VTILFLPPVSICSIRTRLISYFTLRGRRGKWMTSTPLEEEGVSEEKEEEEKEEEDE